MQERKKQVKRLWKDLVESAFDFFEKAIKEYEEFPKYAVLHLAASVELFLKSRLMAEHWSLIFASNLKPNFDKFYDGDFQSVRVDDAIEKLNGILPVNLHVPIETVKEFKSLFMERNKIAHFLHRKISDEKLKEGIISQQCRVWYYLHDLLGNVWREQYQVFEKQILEFGEKMRGQKKFLEAKFHIIEPILEKLKGQGQSVSDCDICGFESLVLHKDKNIFDHARCEVCQYNHRVLKIKCPKCKKDNIVDYGDASCSCGYSFSPSNLAKIMGISELAGDTDYETHSIYCPYCEIDSVYPSGDGYICLNCFELFDTIESCEWCNEYWAGRELSENSYYFGCGNCGGQKDWYADKD